MVLFTYFSLFLIKIIINLTFKIINIYFYPYIMYNIQSFILLNLKLIHRIAIIKLIKDAVY
ncbi:protein of unknown function [Clostridium beijerinckii]|nr:protein of unknown function [Clostridium beijerinckii]